MAITPEKTKTRAKPVRTRGGPEAVDVHVGANRIGASRLHHISEVLDIPISYFFEELSPSYSKTRGKKGLAEAQAEYDHDPMAKRETLELVRSYYKIKDPRVRRRLFELTKQLGKTLSGD